jgi:P-type E1-E2 ATPase
VWVCRGGDILGMLCVADSPRPEAQDAVAALHALQLKTIMLTGDTPEAAESIAEAVGIDVAYGGLLPEGKMALVSVCTCR